jgi:hypothetical protein
VLKSEPDQLVVKALQYVLRLGNRRPVHNDDPIPYLGWECVRQVVAFADWEITEPATRLICLADVEKAPTQPDAVDNRSLECRLATARSGQFLAEPVRELEAAFTPESRGLPGIG